MAPSTVTFQPPNHANSSSYTLNTVNRYSLDDYDNAGDTSPLLSSASSTYGTTPTLSPSSPSPRKLVLNAALKMACIFVLSTVTLGGILWLALPTLEEDDRPLLRIPKSFVQLQELNGLLKKYRDIYPYRIFICYVTTYLFLQAFSLPGSMYLSILGGAVWGVPRALPLACACVATGATLCYLISSALGPALLTLPKWKARLDTWATKIQENKENLISFLIVLRIAPLPPHWVVNIVCPHVGIGIIPFWISTALGIFGVTVIHTTIGGGLDDMTSADDFHLISWRNFFGLAAIVVGVLVPVGLRYWFGKEVQTISETVEEGDDDDALPNGDRILSVGGPAVDMRKGKSLLTRSIPFADPEDFDYSDDDDDDDVILEAGPAIASQTKGDNESVNRAGSSRQPFW
ncbi:hypothetical protein BDN72DRAFT_795457 [Pluteus cervinus]|uniref:Uncharacterized protein n=1 Tax=Pluteus cervinus TaxID=181527 RepID=A0ACD3AY81_9AGAR|nr:hypothetical protein BDN72DRAFT_795457 [Pluteus cervinus]